MSEITVLLADDHELVRSAIARLLDREPGFRVVGQAGDATEAFEAVCTLNPDIVLMDVDMPGAVPFDIAGRITGTSQKTAVVFLSAYYHDRAVDDAMASGAAGYIVKTEPPDELLAALRQVAEGGTYYSKLVRDRLATGPTGKDPMSRGARLTKREVEVLRHLASGLSKREIAELLGRSVKTVDHHVSNLMTKLDIHDRVELTRYAIREGLTQA